MFCTLILVVLGLLSQDSYEYPGEIVILKGFEEATTDEDNNEEGNEFKSKELIEVHNS